MKNHFSHLFLKSVIAMMLGSFSASFAFAQDVPNVIPPSPEAASIVGYGNTGVNFYTGSPSLSIPIYTASSRGFSLPVNLSYSGFGGIKVEEVAPWVGLGWSLNAGGVVSRTIRGFGDDQAGGYTGEPALLDLDNSTIPLYKQYADGDLDGEPDEYNYNVGGMSGTFYINKAKQVVEKVKSNVKITPVFAGNAVTQFEITSTNGTKYILAEQEKTKSFEIGEVHTNYTFKTTSWYLTKVKDQDGYTLMTLTYNTWSGLSSQLKNINYFPQNELELGVIFGSQHMKKSWTYTEAKRIKEISFDHGKILFNKSSTKRQDHLNDYRLDNIEVKDENDVLVKKFGFYYSYFTKTGTAAITSSPTGLSFQGQNTGDHERRLRLDEVKGFGNDGTTVNPGHVFTYNSSYYLPSRFSFALDHWGYYNGQDSNYAPEPVQKVRYYGIGGTAANVGLGTANREPSEAHAQAGVLTKVTYPTGGSTAFTFGQHQAMHDKLTNDFTQQNLNFDPNGSLQTFTLNLINQPYQVLTINADATGTCNIEVEVYESDGTTVVTGATMTHTGGLYSHGSKTITLLPDTYKIKATMQGCSWQVSDNINLKWDDEVFKANKPVGGLRVEAIEDHDGINAANDVRREFYYNLNGDNGTSSSTGRVLNVPTYGAQEIINLSASGPTINMQPQGYRRTIQSTYPLMKTNGAEVGYGKVTVRTVGATNNGKTEYHFTTASDYQDLYDGYYYSALNGETYFTLGAAGSHETYPYPRADSREYLRGLLTMQVDYRWTGSTYHKVKQVENTYAGLYNAPSNNGSLLPWVSFLPISVATNNMNYTSVEGAIWKPGIGNHFKRYRFYSGKVALQKTVTRSYTLGSNSMHFATESTNYWDDLSADYYQVSRTQTKDSEDITYETKYFYPYDVYSLAGLSTAEINALNAMKTATTYNMVGTVVQQEQYKGSTKLSTTRTNFANYSGYYLPSSIEAAKGTNSLETRVTFNEYDSYGNVLGVSKDGGPQERFVYGYDNQLPTAQVTGATTNGDIAYTSFEQNGHGNYVYSGASYTDANAPTGTKYYRLVNGSVTRYSLNTSKKYKVTYYAKNGTPSINGVIASNDSPSSNGNGWKYYEKIVSGVIYVSLSGSAYIDELRVYPVDAQMTTYTYAPMYGLTSQADANHGVVKYQYDKFGRLELIKDLDGKVVQAYQYKYQATTSN